MKKFVTAILVFDLIAGLLFLGLQESRGQIPTAGEAAARNGGSSAADGRAVTDDEDVMDKGDVTDNGDVTDKGDVTDDEDVRKIAITFDDGPHPFYTEQLLDGLKERGVHATFFVTGAHAELHPDIIKRMQEDA